MKARPTGATLRVTMSQTSSVEPSASASSSSARSLVDLVEGGARYRDISSYLDALSPADKLAQVLAVTGKRVGKLYDCVADAPTTLLEEFAPNTLAEGETLIYEGRNSLPMFTRFQKRFQRGKDGIVVGFNFQTMSFVTGPGYFVVVDGDDFKPNELLFDYTREPPFFPAGWPEYKPNTKGLSKQVYGNMKDYCRRVAKGVVVGAAFRNGKAEGAWFTLTHA
jgi:hypothetical protein